jgi:hypothetical protein
MKQEPVEMPADEIEIFLEVELSFEYRLTTYSFISWRKAYKDPI